jgi:hypothetical protein
MKLTKDTTGIILDRYIDTWRVIETKEFTNGEKEFTYFLLENEKEGDNYPAIITNQFGEVIADDVVYGFKDDDFETFISRNDLTIFHAKIETPKIKEDKKVKRIQFSYWDISDSGALQINRRIAKLRVGLGDRSEREITIMEYNALRKGSDTSNNIRVCNETK